MPTDGRAARRDVRRCRLKASRIAGGQRVEATCAAADARGHLARFESPDASGRHIPLARQGRYSSRRRPPRTGARRAGTQRQSRRRRTTAERIEAGSASPSRCLSPLRRIWGTDSAANGTTRLVWLSATRRSGTVTPHASGPADVAARVPAAVAPPSFCPWPRPVVAWSPGRAPALTHRGHMVLVKGPESRSGTPPPIVACRV
jgi:hypothetical protein